MYIDSATPGPVKLNTSYIREKAGVIAKKIEGNPLDPEKAAKDQIEDPEVAIKEEATPHNHIKDRK